MTADCVAQQRPGQLRANTLAEMARKAAYLGDLDEALELVEHAQVGSERLTATARAMLSTVRARLLALAGRHVEARDDVGRADAEFAKRSPDTDPPWLCYYDAAEHQGSTGKALIPTAHVGGRPEPVIERLDAAIRTQAADYPRSRAFSRVRLASVLMTAGYPREAAPIGHRAVLDATAVRSTRLRSEIRDLARTAVRYAQLGEVVELRRDIGLLDGSAG